MKKNSKLQEPVEDDGGEIYDDVGAAEQEIPKADDTEETYEVPEASPPARSPKDEPTPLEYEIPETSSPAPTQPEPVQEEETYEVAEEPAPVLHHPPRPSKSQPKQEEPVKVLEEQETPVQDDTYDMPEQVTIDPAPKPPLPLKPQPDAPLPPKPPRQQPKLGI